MTSTTTDRDRNPDLGLFLPEPEPREVFVTVISVDDHVVEPIDTFEGRVPGSTRGSGATDRRNPRGPPGLGIRRGVLHSGRDERRGGEGVLRPTGSSRSGSIRCDPVATTSRHGSETWT